MTSQSPFLDVPPFPVERYAALADRLKTVLATRNDVIFVQAEAILALEAAATSLGRPGLVALNIVTSPYGGYFGDWLRRAGADVLEIVAEPGRPVRLDAVAAALAALPRVDLVAMVHAETSSGIVNPLPEIAAAARERGALLIVDAVASVGGHPLDVDALGIDLCVIGPQKALGGPAGLSAVSVSARAWDAMAPKNRPQRPYVLSSLSLVDIKTNWLDRGRGMVPGMPSALEFWALDAALDRVEQEGLRALISRHQRASRATRAGLAALGVTPWITSDDEASALVTAAPVPPGTDAGALIAIAAEFGVTFSASVGPIRDRLVRLDHTGRRAIFAATIANVTAYGAAIQRAGGAADLGAAVDAVTGVFAAK